jgi:predicted DNA-binding transcriptional regulator AlpA
MVVDRKESRLSRGKNRSRPLVRTDPLITSVWSDPEKSPPTHVAWPEPGKLPPTYPLWSDPEKPPPTHFHQDPLLTDHDLERLTGRSRSSWQKARLTGGGPPFIRLGRRLVRYRMSEFNAWLAACPSLRSTSDMAT